MNLEMPSPEQTDSLRTLLLIVLGVMIVTIPVVCLLVIAKVKAQQRQRPVAGKQGSPAAHDGGVGNAVLFTGSSLSAGSALTSQDGGAQDCRPESSSSGNSSSDGGISCSGDSGGGSGGSE